jgi:hypothetical protein
MFVSSIKVFFKNGNMFKNFNSSVDMYNAVWYNSIFEKSSFQEEGEYIYKSS